MSSLYCWHISYRTAPIELREDCAFSSAKARSRLLADLMRQAAVRGCMLLSTCNRTEVYLSAAGPAEQQWLYQRIAAATAVPTDKLEPASRIISGNNPVAAHLMRVASGLDSKILGEPQILGQVRAAWQESQDNGSLDEGLYRLAEMAVNTARQVRSQTEIGAGAVSVPAVAARQYRKIFAHPQSLCALIIGSGKVARLAAERLKSEGIGRVLLLGRSPDKVRALADALGAEAADLSELEQHLWRADIVVGASASPRPVVMAAQIRRALQRRNYRPQLLLDLALPRDIEPSVAKLSDAYLMNLDQLEEEAGAELHRRKQAVAQAEVIIAQGVQAFDKAAVAARSAELVKAFRTYSQQQAQREFDRLRHLLNSQKLTEEVLQQSLRALSRRLAHLPTLALRQVGESDLDELLAQIASADAQAEQTNGKADG